MAETEQEGLLDSCGQSTGISNQQALSTDSELNAEIDCSGSAVKI